MVRDSLPQSRGEPRGRSHWKLPVFVCARLRADIHAFARLCGNLNQQNLSRRARPAPELFKALRTKNSIAWRFRCLREEGKWPGKERKEDSCCAINRLD